MKKSAICILLFCMCVLVHGESYKYGPVKNYQGTQPVGLIFQVPITTSIALLNPFTGVEHHVASRGGQEIRYTIQEYPIIANSYVEFETSESNPFNPDRDPIILTEIWARNLRPGSPLNEPPISAGFMPGEIEMPREGFHISHNGLIVPTTMPREILIRELMETPELEGYDVSSIIEERPEEVVYMTQAVVPANEFIVETPSPYLLVDSIEEWKFKLTEEWPDVHIRPLTLEEGNEYLAFLKSDPLEGEPYERPGFSTKFIPSELYIYGGDNDPENDPNKSPDDAGLVMVWGGDSDSGERMSGWALDYGDPDLTNCIITVSVTPPSSSSINRISLGMEDINGVKRHWWWNVPGIIPYGGPTTVTIDTSMTGVGATNPPASGYNSGGGFDITKVQLIVADENANWISSIGSPAPGGTGVPRLWNYWHNIKITPKIPGGPNSKWYVKYSQPPVEVDEGLINGWDEKSFYIMPPMMADDWKCEDERPITDIHWWGSFVGWTQPNLPKIVPSAFHIGIWTDKPDPNPTPGKHDGENWSHPLTLVWENVCKTSAWNFAGYDLDPRDGNPDQQKNEACFQWAQLLNQDEWFRQKPMEDGMPNVYWLSIAAIYPANTEFDSPEFYPWGWKTRPHLFNDDAVQILKSPNGNWPPVIGTTLNMYDCDPIHINEVSWDLAFELTTNEPGYQDNPIPGDIGGPGFVLVPDRKVDIYDLAILASNWLMTAP